VCTCDAGRLSFDCNTDMPCTSTTCGGSNAYWCAPDVTRISCTSDLRGVSGTCKCWSGAMINVSCNQRGKTCEDLCAGR
jgi:hypothetical protein